MSVGEEPYARNPHVRFRGGGTVNRNGKRIVRHGRGNPDTELRQNLKRPLIPLLDDSKFKICFKELTNFRICYKALISPYAITQYKFLNITKSICFQQVCHLNWQLFS
jgi:hypothetical protein